MSAENDMNCHKLATGGSEFICQNNVSKRSIPNRFIRFTFFFFEIMIIIFSYLTDKFSALMFAIYTHDHIYINIYIYIYMLLIRLFSIRLADMWLLAADTS